MSLIVAENISIEFDGKPVLHDVSLKIKAGEIVTVVGPNGAGKSSLVKLLVGAIKANSGSVKSAENLRIGYVPQKLHVDTYMPLTVERFLKMQRVFAKGDRVTSIEQTQISKLLKKPIAHLSGGELKRVLLAYALSAAPQLLILDEPTAGLDQPAIIAFYALVEKLRIELGIAVLLVSHDLNVVMRASDRVICLNTHICCQGTPSDVSTSPEFLAMFGRGDAPVALYTHKHQHSHDDALCLHEDH